MGTPIMDKMFVQVMRETSECLKKLDDFELGMIGRGVSRWRHAPELRVFLDTLSDSQLQAVARAANAALMCEAEIRTR